MTVVRILKTSIGELEATNQYGILSGKVDTLVALPFSFNMAFATALVPAISAAIAKKQKHIAEKRIEFSILVTILIGLPCTIYMAMFAKEILLILFPNASNGAEMLQLSSFTIIFIVLTQTINGALQGFGKVNVPVIAFAFGGVIKLILNLILIPINKIGIYGAIISSIVSDICVCLICFITLKKCLNNKFEFNKFFIKPIISSIFMTFSSYIIYSKFTNQIKSNFALLLISIIIGMLVYIISIIMTKNLSKEEVCMLPLRTKDISNIWKKNWCTQVKSTYIEMLKHENLRNRRLCKKIKIKKKDFS